VFFQNSKLKEKTMTTQNIELGTIQISQSNPRKTFDDEKINGLAKSIQTDGLLQNIVVQPIEGKEGKYHIVSGERRVRAIRKLAEQGKIASDYKIPAIIRDDMDKDETLRIATVENVQRENLTPMEEAAAFAKLVKNGDTLDEIAAQTGLTPQTIKRRCALNGLCSEAKKALADKVITLAQAEALTLGSNKAQQRCLEYIDSGDSPSDIRETLIGGQPTVSMALFPISSYKGKPITDLFDDAETAYFEDEDQFLELQKNAVKELAAYFYNQTAAKWVDVTENFRLNDWQYEEAEDGQPYGVLINISPSGEVDIKEGLTKPEKLDEETAEETAAAPKKARPPYSKPMCEYTAWHKSMAVQETLLYNPGKVKELTVLRALERLRPHSSFDKLADLPNQQAAYGAIEEQANRIVEILELELDDDVTALDELIYDLPDTAALYEVLKTLSDEQLDEVLEFVTIIEFGQYNCETPDSDEDSLFNLVAKDIQVQMREHWTPDITFLNGRTQSQLVDIAKESGYVGFVGGYKKAELVNCLLKHFEGSVQATAPNDREQKAKNWLPSIMQFPTTLPKQDD
jgi:ParB family transcriptional regulator, chromosome partitioning protein